MKHLFLLLVSSVGILETSAQEPTCYFPNGRDMNALERSEVYHPCNSNTEFSMCCAAWDKCRPDGLCASGFDGNIWRDGCTDPTWKSPSCIKLCDTGLGQYHVGKDMDLTTATFTVTPCNDGSFCCGNGTIGDTCCRQNRGLFLVNGSAERINPISLQSSSSPTTSSATKTQKSTTSSTSLSSSAASSTAFSASSVTFSVSPGIPAFTVASSSTPVTLSSSTPDASSTEKKNSSVKVGAIVGGVVGGVAFLFLMIGAVLLWKRRRFNNAGNQPIGHELFTNEKPHEAPSNYRRQELDAANPLLMIDPSRIRHEAP